MPFLRSFGHYLPERVVTSDELALQLGVDVAWMRRVSGIDERRFAATEETVADMAVIAARNCLEAGGVEASELGMILVSSGSSEQPFPGPAAVVASRLGLNSTPAIDLPMASAGALFGMGLAAKLSVTSGPVLVVGSEKMSRIIRREPMDRNTAILFGDGAGACLIHPESGFARVQDSLLLTDGAFANNLRLDADLKLWMDGLTVILQASRKLPRVILELLERNGYSADQVQVMLLHQANQNLMNKVALALGVPDSRFFSNVGRYGNTSSASMLIAASEWRAQVALEEGRPIVFSAFGAGFHWGALLAVPV